MVISSRKPKEIPSGISMLKKKSIESGFDFTELCFCSRIQKLLVYHGQSIKGAMKHEQLHQPIGYRSTCIQECVYVSIYTGVQACVYEWCVCVCVFCCLGFFFFEMFLSLGFFQGLFPISGSGTSIFHFPLSLPYFTPCRMFLQTFVN